MRLAMLAAIVAAAVAGDAAAVEHHLLQWKKDRQCEVVVRPPYFGSHFVELGVYASEWEAERELDDRRRRRECPPAIRPEREPETPGRRPAG